MKATKPFAVCLLGSGHGYGIVTVSLKCNVGHKVQYMQGSPLTRPSDSFIFLNNTRAPLGIIGRVKWLWSSSQHTTSTLWMPAARPAATSLPLPPAASLLSQAVETCTRVQESWQQLLQLGSQAKLETTHSLRGLS